MTTYHRRLAGLRGATPPDTFSPYHADAREAALLTFGRAYEQGLLGAPPAASADDGAPTYLIAGGPDEELLVLAGVWPAAGTSCGRLVAPRELLARLLAAPETSAVWCDDERRECLALTAARVSVGGEPMLLLGARTARLLGETLRGTELAFEEEWLEQDEWTPAEIDAFLRDHDGDALLAAETRVDEIAAQIQE